MAAKTWISEAGVSSPTAFPTRAALPGELVRMKAIRFCRFGFLRNTAIRRAKPTTRDTRSSSGA